MKLSIRPFSHKATLTSRTLTQVPTLNPNHMTLTHNLPNWQQLLNPVDISSLALTPVTPITTNPTTAKQPVRKSWMDYQGFNNWENLLDPLDDNLRGEIIRYGQFVDAAYKAFEFDPDSNFYATCKYSKASLRREVVIAFRGPAMCLEWLKNLGATLTQLPSSPNNLGTDLIPSLQQMLRQEIGRLLQSYGNEPLSITFTGHSLGAALATLAAYDIKTTFNRSPLVTVFSFAGPRVGNSSFRRNLDEKGPKVLRIVNSDDVITKVPGFVVDDSELACDSGFRKAVEFQNWIHQKVEDTQLSYAEVGKELRLSSKDSPYLMGTNVSTCHELSTYLHLVDNFQSSKCPFKATAH
ncbi:hypothetical protein C1H46_044290 [Malus baccata]|uniref:Fungal lipase-type domain-containing protein n=1 Tax=Malus baccata TaxID=106549 RepID=A0A540K7I0_MALBA|nr:hypothetical protein C1H46_044290 [Malus baccata]